MFVNGLKQNEQSKDASYQVSIHLAKWFQRRRFFRNQPITDRDEMCYLYRRHAIDASYQVTVHLAKRFRRRRLKKNRPIRNKNCLWRPCLLMNRDKINNLYRGPSIDASYKVSLHLAEGFQRRRLTCEKNGRQTTDDGRQVMAKAHIAFGKVNHRSLTFYQ
jgi:hypothetical protein